MVILIDHSAADPVADLTHYLKIFDDNYDGRIVLGVSQVDKMPERELSIYRDYLAGIGRNLPLFPVDMRKREDVLLLVESIIASLEQSE